MALERIELRFSPGNPNERALIEALNAQGSEYGAKGRFLKERLLRGYTAILRELDGLMAASDPMAALDRRAQSVDSRHYRVLRVLLITRQGVDVQQSVQAQAPAPPVVQAPVPVVPPVEPRPGGHHADFEDAPGVETPQAAVEAMEESAADVPPKKHDWSAFGRIAGVKKGE